ncbi:hypothetical protein HPA88_02685 [Streptococcus suis]|uniref:hypothetical protein n=1 Tax=Streptococcus suis TaxID=1307 RepID=UPI0004187808|nr:hypothetical protein [Streptococcus suis]MCO8179619.1 hypothetical protein [Streptococcus suis]NQF64782.1 hypothetical protein [Streptococcus suis]NQF88094.1 hypothetical protein [Streptococcus suis]NQG31110.1 hypothetical protein [Streptococcus suis]NQG37123.1 hypothetical protein [Streptococcus suis]
MQTIQFKNFEINISERLHTIYDGKDEILIIFPNYTTICCQVKLSQAGRLLVDTFWGVEYEISGNMVTIYYTDEEELE